jgi:hypothetical protein
MPRNLPMSTYLSQSLAMAVDIKISWSDLRSSDPTAYDEMRGTGHPYDAELVVL